MTPGRYNMVCPQGATFNQILSYSSGGFPVDLTDRTARMQVRVKHSSTSSILSLTTENSGITLGGVAGTINIVIDADTTSELTPKEYVYDLEIVHNDDVTRLIEGKFIVTPEVTK